jgi:crotonobetainyl-CoA:carnitine CoA-transferase CaiB-like acyl-CoA transferase
MSGARPLVRHFGLTEPQWQSFKKVLGCPTWADEARFTTASLRFENRQDLDTLIQGWTQEHSPEAVTLLLQREGVPAGTVQNASDLAHDPQLRERGFFIQLDHPELGSTIGDASPINLTENPAEYRRASPVKGQDNDYVYRELLGLSGEEIEQLHWKGVI